LKKISRIHDRFFKQIFSHKEVMLNFIEQTFPKNIVEKLNLATLNNDTNSYIDKKLKENFSDLVYSCFSYKLVELKIALLFEHKSEVVDFPQFQLLDYIKKIWDSCLKQDEKRILVIPIIFYHGKKTWIKRELSEYFGDIDEEFKRFIPKFEYILINISKFSDAKIKNYKLYELQITIFLFKYIFNKKELKQKFNIFFKENKELSQNEEDFFITFFEYLKNNLKQNDMEEVIEKIKKNKKNEGNIFVENFIKRYREQGILQGIEKGIEQGKELGIELAIEKVIRKNKYNLGEIAEMFDVSIDLVLDIKNRIDKKS